MCNIFIIELKNMEKIKESRKGRVERKEESKRGRGGKGKEGERKNIKDGKKEEKKDNSCPFLTRVFKNAISYNAQGHRN